MSPHRFWRVIGVGTGNTYLCITSLTLHTSFDQPNIAVSGNGTPFSDSSYRSDTTPDKAFDENQSTYWESAAGAGNHYVGWDFGVGNEKAITRATITNSTYTNESLVNGQIQYSDNGSSWISVKEISKRQTFTYETTPIYFGDTPASCRLLQAPAALPISSRDVVELKLLEVNIRRIPDSGGGKIVGTVKVAGAPDVPVSRRVRLIEDRSGRVVDEMWSTPGTGEYAFIYLDMSRAYSVYSMDHTGVHAHVIEGPLYPEAM
jgi:hypothetical protein